MAHIYSPFDSATLPGQTLSTTDPAGMVIRMGYDGQGRVIEQIQNYVESPGSSSSGGSGCGASADINVILRTSYNADGNVSTLTAVNAETGNQVTTYVYGTTLDTSDVATSTLKRKEIFPDSEDDDDAITFRYNRQSQPTIRTDQNGTVHAYDYDAQGRMIQDRVTALGAGIDGMVRRIETTYDARGLRKTIASYDNPTVGAGTTLDEVLAEYNDFDQLVTEYQEHEGAVNILTSPKVQYSYESGSDNTTRPLTLVYPNGRTLTYDYGTEGGTSDAASRIEAIVDDDDTRLVEYSYLGRGTFVVADDTEPQVKWTLVDLEGEDDPDTGDIYSGLDRFSRIKDNRWYNYDADENVDRLQYGYDRASNRLWRKNLVATALGKEFDELYSYDGLHRLKDMGRGLLNETETTLTSQTFAQCWMLDTTGNWSSMNEADTGGSWTLKQTRTASGVNEITSITNTVGEVWAQPVYDRAGNMTGVPQPKTPTDSYQIVYDAWNRMTKVADGGVTVCDYRYDGRRFQIVAAETSFRHAYFTSAWQVLEERLSTSGNPERQFVWGLRYIDEIVLRDRDVDADGELEARLYAGQDVNWNVTALWNLAAEVQERFAYRAFCLPLFLTAAYVGESSSPADWETLSCGYRLDRLSFIYTVRNRQLHSTVGSWMQRDPSGYSNGLSLYCADFVPQMTDPLGLYADHVNITARSWIDVGGIYYNQNSGTFVYTFLGSLLSAIAVSSFTDHGNTPARDDKYRLWTRRRFDFDCCDSKMTNPLRRSYDDVGNEGPLSVGAGIVEGEYFRTVGENSIEFGWTFLGKPNAYAEILFQAARHRQSVYIWHRVCGKITCVGSDYTANVQIDGSTFPVHTLFVAGQKTSELPQTAFTDLWTSHPGDLGRVMGRGPGGSDLGVCPRQ